MPLLLWIRCFYCQKYTLFIRISPPSDRGRTEEEGERKWDPMWKCGEKNRKRGEGILTCEGRKRRKQERSFVQRPLEMKLHRFGSGNSYIPALLDQKCLKKQLSYFPRPRGRRWKFQYFSLEEGSEEIRFRSKFVSLSLLRTRIWHYLEILILIEKKLTYSAAVAAFFLPGCEFGLKCLRSLLEVFLPWKLSSGQARYIGLVQTFF